MCSVGLWRLKIQATKRCDQAVQTTGGKLIASGPAGNMNVEWTSNANPTGVGGAGGGGGACFHPFVRTFFIRPTPFILGLFYGFDLSKHFPILFYPYLKY